MDMLEIARSQLALTEQELQQAQQIYLQKTREVEQALAQMNGLIGGRVKLTEFIRLAEESLQPAVDTVTDAVPDVG